MTNRPLWLPTGSVRAILALLIVGGYVGARLLGVDLDSDYKAAMTLVLGLYFGSRGTQRGGSG